MKYKVGDRVRVYGGAWLINEKVFDSVGPNCTVVDVRTNTPHLVLETEEGTTRVIAATKQCRKLVKKKEVKLGYIQYTDGTRVEIGKNPNNLKVGDRVKLTHTILGTEEPMVGEITHFFDGTIEIRAEHDNKIHGPFFFHEAVKLVKKDWQESIEDWTYGQGITRERYRQMKLKLRRRWNQIADLELRIDHIATWVKQIKENTQLEETTKQDIINELDYLLHHLEK